MGAGDRLRYSDIFILYIGLAYCYPPALKKKRRGHCYRLRPSVRLSVMLSPPQPLDEIQPNLVCELLT